MRRPASNLVDETEDTVAAVAKAGLEDLKALRALAGERPYGKVKLSPDDKALLQLPLWRMAVATHDLAYWREIGAKFGGQAGIEKHDREMRQLDQRKPALAIPGMEQGTEAPQPMGQGVSAVAGPLPQSSTPPPMADSEVTP